MVVFITVGGREEANRIAKALVEERLAACVNLIGPIRSVYWWKGGIEEAEEYLLLIKTVGGRLRELTKKAKSLHSYSVPEIIALRIEGGSAEYLKWLEECTERVK